MADLGEVKVVHWSMPIERLTEESELLTRLLNRWVTAGWEVVSFAPMVVDSTPVVGAPTVSPPSRSHQVVCMALVRYMGIQPASMSSSVDARPDEGSVPDDVEGRAGAPSEVRLLAAGPRIVEVMTQVRRFSGLDLRASKALVDTAPTIVPIASGHGSATDLLDALRSAGATVELT